MSKKEDSWLKSRLQRKLTVSTPSVEDPYFHCLSKLQFIDLPVNSTWLHIWIQMAFAFRKPARILYNVALNLIWYRIRMTPFCSHVPFCPTNSPSFISIGRKRTIWIVITWVYHHLARITYRYSASKISVILADIHRNHYIKYSIKAPAFLVRKV